MIEVEMSRDIRDFEPKVISTFTARQLMCLGIGAAYSLPIALVLPFDIIVKIVIAIVLMAPAVACGWVKLYGMYFDVFFMKVLLPNWTKPAIRKYATENTYAYLYSPVPKDNTSNKKKGSEQQKKIRYTREYRPLK